MVTVVGHQDPVPYRHRCVLETERLLTERLQTEHLKFAAYISAIGEKLFVEARRSNYKWAHFCI